MYVFEIYKDKAGEFRARFKRGKEVVLATEGYATVAKAQAAIDEFKQFAPEASVVLR